MFGVEQKRASGKLAVHSASVTETENVNSGEVKFIQFGSVCRGSRVSPFPIPNLSDLG